MKIIRYGSSSTNDVCINDIYVSRNHCQIIKDGGNIQLVDTSKNGTYVNGTWVHGSSIRLNPTDIVRIGNTTLAWQQDIRINGGGGGGTASAYSIVAISCGAVGALMALIMCFVPVTVPVFMLGIAISAVGVIFGALTLSRHEGLGLAGMITSSVAALADIVLLIISIS